MGIFLVWLGENGAHGGGRSHKYVSNVWKRRVNGERGLRWWRGRSECGPSGGPLLGTQPPSAGATNLPFYTLQQHLNPATGHSLTGRGFPQGLRFIFRLPGYCTRRADAPNPNSAHHTLTLGSKFYFFHKEKNEIEHFRPSSSEGAMTHPGPSQGGMV